MAANPPKLSVSIDGVRALLEQDRPEAALDNTLTANDRLHTTQGLI